MEQAFIELVKNTPWAFVMFMIVKLFLQAEKDREAQRIANAIEASEKQRAHEVQITNLQRSIQLEMNNLWASTVKQIMEENVTSNSTLVTAIDKMHQDLSEQYKNMGITQDLLGIARDELRRTKGGD